MRKFRVTLLIGEIDADGLRFEPYDEVYDDYRSILRDVCSAYDGQMAFSVSGFGQCEWPVDVTTDLPVFLEQLPQALECSSARKDFDIDFYEQGVERRIEFIASESVYLATCASGTEWEPGPPVEMSGAELQEMLSAFLQKFVTATVVLPLDIVARTFLANWYSGKPHSQNGQ